MAAAIAETKQRRHRRRRRDGVVPLTLEVDADTAALLVSTGLASKRKGKESKMTKDELHAWQHRTAAQKLADLKVQVAGLEAIRDGGIAPWAIHEHIADIRQEMRRLEAELRAADATT